MCQMGDPVAAERVVRAMNHATLFGLEIQVKNSNKPSLEDPRHGQDPGTLKVCRNPFVC